MSSGAKVQSYFIRETTPGVTPTGIPWNLLKRTSWGVGPSQNTNDNDEIGGTRMAQGATLGTVDVGGDVGAKFRYGQHDEFLASCFGAEWAGTEKAMLAGRRLSRFKHVGWLSRQIRIIKAEV